MSTLLWSTLLYCLHVYVYNQVDIEVLEEGFLAVTPTVKVPEIRERFYPETEKALYGFNVAKCLGRDKE